MLQRLRQVACLVRDLEEGRELYRRVLGMEPCHSEELSGYGLRRLVFPAGNGTFLELLQPTSADTAAGRFLERRGEAPYLLVFETAEYDLLMYRLRDQGLRIIDEVAYGWQRWAFIHPSSLNGTFIQVIEVSGGDNPWPAAGPRWRQVDRSHLTSQLRQVAVLVRDLDSAVRRWEELFGLRATARFQVSFTNLEIAVIPLAGWDTFVELAQPTGGDTPAARFLERRGEGIYLIIYQIDDSLAVDAHLSDLGVRYATSRETQNYTNLGFNSIWLHPSAMKGAFTQLSQVLVEDNPWPPAGESWHRGQAR